MNPKDVVDRYFASVRARDIDSLIALYAEDASFTLPNGKQFNGAANIRELHLSVFAAGAPMPTPTHVVLGGAAAAVEIEARLPDGSIRRTANFYQFDQAGRIQRLSVYMQGG